MGWKDLFRSLWIKDTEMEKYMFLIVGLGNPGKQYEHTRHNIGFDVMDALAEKYNISISEKKHKALCGKGVINGVKVVLAKPQNRRPKSPFGETADLYELERGERGGAGQLLQDGSGRGDDRDL